MRQPLIDPYAIYQHLMDYWAQVMQDDGYLIAAEGWKAETYRVIETKKGKDGKPGKQVDRGWDMNLVPLCTNQSIAAIFPNASRKLSKFIVTGIKVVIEIFR